MRKERIKTGPKKPGPNSGDRTTQSGTIQKGNLERGVTAMIENGRVTSDDRVVIIADRKTTRIADLLKQKAEEIGAEVEVIIMEDLGERPLTELPEKTRGMVERLAPTVSYFAASCQDGELAFRKPLMGMLTKDFNVRHIHMPGIDEAITSGAAMCADYDIVGKLTAAVYDIVKNAKRIKVTTADQSTELDIELDPENINWFPANGRPEPGEGVNNPDGECFTTPKNVNGWATTILLGDHFDSRGQLDNPIKIWIEDEKATKIECRDKEMEAEFWEYLKRGENTDRVGEIGIPTNLPGMITGQILGNMLADEKLFLHIAFGDPLGAETGATWEVVIPGDPKATQHCDATLEMCTVEVDKFVLIQDGMFTDEVLQKAGIDIQSLKQSRN